MKKRLNKYHRLMIIDWMFKEKIDKNEGQKELLIQLDCVTSLINVTLRNKYPVSDMIILRKYNLTRIDTCLTFKTGTDGGFLFTTDFTWKYNGEYQALAKQNIVDIPASTGCYTSKNIFEAPLELNNAINKFDDLYNNVIKINEDKRNKYRSFVHACKYLEEIEEVVTLPDDIRIKITGSSTALTIINPDLIKSIKEDFKCQ